LCKQKNFQIKMVDPAVLAIIFERRFLNILSMNTAQYIPYDCVAPVLLRNEKNPSHPFLKGTGFFVKFDPFDKVFFVTAKHCVLDGNGSDLGILLIRCAASPDCSAWVVFEERILTNSGNGEDDLEDLAVYVVGEMSSELKEKVGSRALRLSHQDEVELILTDTLVAKGKVRVVGYPYVSVDFNYEHMQATVQPRGFVGDLISRSDNERFYKVELKNWKEGEPQGFSGSPIIGFSVDGKGDVCAMPLGVLQRGSVRAIEFLSINVVTDLIAGYLIGKE
jgi:hypothetical protein